MSDKERGFVPPIADSTPLSLDEELEEIRASANLNSFHANLPGGRRRWVMDDPVARDLEHNRTRIAEYKMMDDLILELGFDLGEVEALNRRRTEAHLRHIEETTDDNLSSLNAVKEEFFTRYEFAIYEALRKKFPDVPGWKWES